MVIVSASRSLHKLERKCFDPQWLRPVLDDLPDGFLLESRERIVYINTAYASYLDYRPHEVLMQDVCAVVADVDAGRLRQYSRRRASHEPAPGAYDFLARRKNGSTLRLDATVSCSKADHQVLIATVARPALSVAGAGPDDSAATTLHLRNLLSPREFEVMEMILAGKRIKEIALALLIDAKTVATHRWRMMNKLHLADSRALFQYALRHRLIDWE
ncbi:MAG: hypothetical protein NVSMB68_13060 [Thermoanaerobaculia bacterium]